MEAAVMIAHLRNANRRNRFGRSVSRSRRLAVETLENRLVLATSYIATDLVSDQPGVAPIVDNTLHNAWGISISPTGGNFWVSSEGGGISDVYSGDVGGAALAK